MVIGYLKTLCLTWNEITRYIANITMYMQIFNHASFKETCITLSDISKYILISIKDSFVANFKNVK